MSSRNGLKNEIEIIRALNKKRFFKLNNNLKFNLQKIFDSITPLSRFIAQKCNEQYCKPDIFIKHKKQTAYISIKCGHSSTVHEEYLKSFILFLRERNISAETQKTIILFHYGDGTLDGTGKTRLPYAQISLVLAKRIKKANIELNSNKQLITDFINRVLFDGNKDYQEKAEYIYYGTTEFGVICSKEQILSHILRKNYSYLNNLHIGPILFYPYARYIDFRDTHPQKRKIVQFSWPNFSSDLDYIARRYEL